MRVAFLQTYRMSDHFMGDALVPVMVAALREDGHEAEVAEYVVDGRRDVDEQLRELRTRLDERAYGLIFVERPWSPRFADALRGLPLVALRHPALVDEGHVPMALEGERIDVVRMLVRALSAGEPAQSVAGVRVRLANETRHGVQLPKLATLDALGDATFDHLHHALLSRGSRSNPERAQVLVNTGCAYRNVPNRTGTFDGVPMPPDVSTAGCTFCTASAYERMTETESVDLAVRQIESLIHARPELRELAIKDDYAIRYLDALGLALGGVALGDREVLFSARADYLLEHRATIERALAGAFPARLGFYLIGFENFSAAELDRFNKGLSPEQIERAVGLLREWRQSYPGRLRLTATGGFILFTPWTRLEDLRINAEAIRRLQFEELRGDPLLSRLRLYPELPLYWLAERDGLLQHAARDDEQSDAARRGYRIDVPWRFADPAVEAVNRRLLDAHAAGRRDLLDQLDDALDDAAGRPRGARNRELRLVSAPRGRVGGGAGTYAIITGTSCNQRCGFCTFRRDTPTEDPATREARALAEVREAARAGAKQIVLTGAEPMLEPHLLRLATVARELGIESIVVETNATLIDAHRAIALASAGVTRARVALSSLDSSISDALTNDAGGHARTLTGTRALLDAGIAVELAIALVPSTAAGAQEVVRGLRELLSPSAARIERVVPRWIGRGAHGESMLAPRLAARAMMACFAAAREVGIACEVAPDGDLPACVFDEPENHAATLRTSLRLGTTLVAREAARRSRIPACASCSLAPVCPGTHPSVADAVQADSRPLDDDAARALAPTSEVRARQLLEYRSRFWLGAAAGAATERRVVRVNFHCNQSCDFCFVSRELPPIEPELVEREIREAAAVDAILDFSGGEPTLNPRLVDFLTLARDLHVRHIELQTNAVRCADADYARSLADAGLRAAFVSLHGVTPEVSDRVTAAPGTFVRTVAGIRNLMRAGVLVRLNWVLCGYNVEELPRLPDFARDVLCAGIDGAELGLNFSFVAASTDNVPRDTRLIPRFSEVAWALAEAAERAAQLGIDLTGFDSKCGVPACYLPASVRERHFARDLPEEEWSAHGSGFVRADGCASCDLARRCYGVRNAYARMYGTEELRPIIDGVPTAQLSRPPRLLASTAPAQLSTQTRVRAQLADRVGRSYDAELTQLGGHLRQLVKRERPSLGAAEEAARILATQGLHVAVVAAPHGRGVAFAGASAAIVEAAVALEPRLHAASGERDDAVRRMGALLGYPTCCVERFVAAGEHDDETHFARLARAPQTPRAPEQNWAAFPVRPMSHFPCGPDCAPTAELVRATLALVRVSGGPSADALHAALASLVAFRDAERCVLLLGARREHDGSYRYDEAVTARTSGLESQPRTSGLIAGFDARVASILAEGDRIQIDGERYVVGRGALTIGSFAASELLGLLDFTGRSHRVRLGLASRRV